MPQNVNIFAHTCDQIVDICIQSGYARAHTNVNCFGYKCEQIGIKCDHFATKCEPYGATNVTCLVPNVNDLSQQM